MGILKTIKMEELMGFASNKNIFSYGRQNNSNFLNFFQKSIKLNNLKSSKYSPQA